MSEGSASALGVMTVKGPGQNASVSRRAGHWQRDFSSHDAYAKSIEPNRRRLAENLGVSREVRPENVQFEYSDTISGPRAESKELSVRRVRWRAFGDVHGVGLF